MNSALKEVKAGCSDETYETVRNYIMNNKQKECENLLKALEKTQWNQSEPHSAASSVCNPESRSQARSCAISRSEISLSRNDHTNRPTADGDDGSDSEGNGSHYFLLSEEGNHNEHDGNKD